MTMFNENLSEMQSTQLGENMERTGGNPVADDIVTRLRDGLPPQSCKCVRCDAADEIERLRAAGDALAAQITRPCRCVEAHDGAINETCAPCAACFDWQEARRG